MRINRFILFMVMVLACAGQLWAQNPTFSIVPPRNVIQGRNFSLTFRLSDGEANPPAAPNLNGCTLLYGPATSTMQSTQIINGRMSSSRSIDYTFTYRADTPGKVTVPELTISCEGKTLTSRSASFEILPTDEPVQTPGSSQGQSSQQGGAPQGSVNASDLLVRVSFSKNSVYEQEPVVATIKVYTKHDISSFLPTVQPAFEGFLSEELPVAMESSIEHYNGQNYHTAVLKRLLLYPQKSGKLSVNSGTYDVTIVMYETVNMGFFRTQRPVERAITTTSNAATIEVKPLPEPRPANFSGAVGQFSVSTSLDPELMRTNEASVYTYTIKGTGNIKFLNEPIVQFPAGIDTYTPKSNIDAKVIGGGSNMSGTYSTEFTIVPQEVGNFTIEGVPFVYFDPAKKEYVTVEVADMPIKVLRGANSPVAQAQSKVEEAIDDILHIHPTRANSQYKVVNYAIESSLYWAAYVIAALILVGLVFLYRRQIRLNADVAGRKLAKAGKIATKRLKEAHGFMKERKSDAFYASLAKALWGYISDKLAISASQLTRDNVSEKLSDYGLNSEEIANVLNVLDECEMARFTPNHSEQEMVQLYNNASDAIKNIEDAKTR